MNFFLTLNISFKLARTILILFIFFSGNLLYSQPDENVKDTTVKLSEVSTDELNDDSAEMVEEPPPEVYNADEENNEPEYFDQKGFSPLQQDSLQMKFLHDSVKKAMQREKDFWYANFDFEKEEKKIAEEKIPWSERAWFKTLMWLIIIGGFAFALIWYLGGSHIGLFRRTIKGIEEENQIAETENIFEINYKDRIERAIQAGNYRLAVRLMFLQMLKSLAGRNIIQYKQDRTNFDYLMQLRSTSHYDDFFKLTRDYEYSWYGDFPVNAETYALIKKDFEKFDSRLSKK